MATVAVERPVRGAWFGVAILCLAVLVCAADQALPSLLIDPIKASFGVSDTEIALLTGFSFSVSISIFALPLSWVADRFDRSRLIAAGIAIWCAATIGCGFARGFWVFFLLRMGVGLGEAVLKPTAYALVADQFPSRRLTRPLALLALAALLGGAAALNGGGAVYEAILRWAIQGGLPRDFAWRGTLVAFGAAGLAIAVAALWIPEPRRGGRSGGAGAQEGGGEAAVSFAAFARKSVSFFAPYIAAMTAYCLYNAGFNAWLAPFFARTYGWSVGRTGQALGVLALGAGLVGLPLGIWLMGAVRRSFGRDAPVAAIWITLAVTAPAVVLTPFAPTGEWALVGLGLILLPASAATVIAPVVFAETAPSHLRARVIALSGLFYGVLGSGLGPVAYGAFTDHILHDPAKLAVCLSVVSGGLTAVFIPLLVLADRHFIRIKRMALEASRSSSACATAGAPEGQA
jgi:MFS family permease